MPNDPFYEIPMSSDDDFFNPKGEEDEELLATGEFDDPFTKLEKILGK